MIRQPIDVAAAPETRIGDAAPSVERRRVLFVVPSLRHGGAEMQVVRLVSGLDTAAFEPHLLYYDEGDALLDRVDASKVRVHRFRKRGRLDLGLIRAIAGIIDEHRIDVLHCTLQYSLFLGWLARMRARRKPALICAIHTTINRNRQDELFDRGVYRFMLRACDSVVFVCRTQRDHWIRKYPELEPRSRVVFNGIDAAVFDPAVVGFGDRMRERLGVPAGAKLVSCIAAFRPEKGHEILVRAFAAVLAEHPGAYLVLAGDGALRERIQRLAAELELDSYIKFPGAVDEIRELLAASDVTVLASTAVETFSIAMLESMSMGVPLVATDMGGTREAVLDGRTGIVVAPNDGPALTRGLLRLLRDDTYRESLGHAARRLVLDRFTEKQMIRETEDILHAAARSNTAAHEVSV